MVKSSPWRDRVIRQHCANIGLWEFYSFKKEQVEIENQKISLIVLDLMIVLVPILHLMWF